MIVLLPEGRAVCNPDSIKMVKVVHSQVQGKSSFVVIVKLDDDTELMIKTLTSAEEAYALADECADLINASDNDDDDDDDFDDDDDDDSFNTGLTDPKRQSVKGEPSANEFDEDSEFALAQAASSTDAGSKALSSPEDDEASSWVLTSDPPADDAEESDWGFSSEAPAEEAEESDWDLSSDPPADDAEESDWVFSSEAPAEEAEESDWGFSDDEPAAKTPSSKTSSARGSGGGSGSGGAGSASQTAPSSSAAEEEEESDWSLSVDVQENQEEESSDWFSDDEFTAPRTSSVAKERKEKEFPTPTPPKIPVVEIKRSQPPKIHEDSLEDSDDWFIDDGNDDWY